MAEDKVRQWLNTHSYEIVDEAMIAENVSYEVIVADYRDNLQQELTNDDILFGLFNKEKYRLFSGKMAVRNETDKLCIRPT